MRLNNIKKENDKNNKLKIYKKFRKLKKVILELYFIILSNRLY